MSADNCIAILVTTDPMMADTKWGYDATYVPADGIEPQYVSGWTKADDRQPVTAYRVAHIQGHDQFEWHEENELHNLGAWMSYTFRKARIFYDLELAKAYAWRIHDDKGYVEYGVLTLDAAKYSFMQFPVDF